ncbi:ABC transporter permease [Candidatus Parcubacteria bacterium]|nr:ABC transporter permease [Candidatus Parcubacteria bacterium]
MKSNLSRTFLTVLGIVIGIASVIIVFSAGAGLENLVLGQIEAYGTDILAVEVRMPSNKKGMSKDVEFSANMAMGVQITTLTLDDIEEINKLPNIKNSYAGITGQEKIFHGSESKKSVLYGVNASYIDIDQGEIEFGRFFTEDEDKTLAKVIVLGSDVKEKLFMDRNAVGEVVKMHKSKYRVVGVMHERGATMGMNFDDFVFIPIRTLQKRIVGINHILYSVHQLYDIDRSEETADEVRIMLRELHDISAPSEEGDTSRDDFRVTSMTEMKDMLGTVTGAITWLLLAIVAISLVVGGVGIMNIMYVIVSERTKEIGLRKAVGAKTNDIMIQFLTESVLITIIGGIIGIIFGIIVSYIISIVANHFGLDWKFVVPLRAFIVAGIFSLFFGIIFGLYPAKKAANMNPIDALRKE